jgi:hypothetical protein
LKEPGTEEPTVNATVTVTVQADQTIANLVADVARREFAFMAAMAHVVFTVTTVGNGLSQVNIVLTATGETTTVERWVELLNTK